MVFLFQMIQDIAATNKGATPDMGDLSDVSAVYSVLKCDMGYY